MTESTLTPAQDVLARIVMLTYGPMQSGQGSYWCYVAVKPSEYERFLKTHKSGKFLLTDFEKEGFGEVIVSGPGIRPPQEVTYKVSKLFNIPIKDLFGEMDPGSVIAAKIAEMKENKG